MDCHSDFNFIKGNVKTKLNIATLVPSLNRPIPSPLSPLSLSLSLSLSLALSLRFGAMRRKMRLIAAARLAGTRTPSA